MPPAKKRAIKQTAAKQAGNTAATQQTTNTGLMKAVHPSAELAAIVGNEPLPRTEITKRMWDYDQCRSKAPATVRRARAGLHVGAAEAGESPCALSGSPARQTDKEQGHGAGTRCTR